MTGAASLERHQERALEAAWLEFAEAQIGAGPAATHMRDAFFAGAIAAIVLRNGPARLELLREVRDYVSGVRAGAPR